MPPSWHPVPACTRNGHSAGGPLFPATTTKLQAGRSSPATTTKQQAAVLPCDNDKAAGGTFYFAATKIRIGRGIVAATTAQAGHSTCRHDGVASILDFKPRLANRCSQEVKTGAIPAAQGLKHYPADGECRMGRLGRGNSSVPAGRLGRGNHQHQAQKKESRLIAESGLSKRGSYLLSHLV